MGDVVVVYKLDPLARSLKVVAQLGKMGINQIALEIDVSKMALYKYLFVRNMEISAYLNAQSNPME